MSSSPCLADSACIALSTDIDGALVADPIISADANNGFECRPDGMWTPRGPVVVDNIPADAEDGDEILLKVGSGDTTIFWAFYYWAAETSDYKWLFTGGPPLVNKRDPAGTIAPGGGNDWATLGATETAGPGIDLPIDAYYNFDFGCRIDSATDGQVSQVGISQTGSDPGDADTASNANEHQASVVGTWFPFDTAYPAGTHMRLMYRCSGTGGTATFDYRWIKGQPVKAKAT
jgi:hypothetical protein